MHLKDYVRIQKKKLIHSFGLMLYKKRVKSRLRRSIRFKGTVQRGNDVIGSFGYSLHLLRGEVQVYLKLQTI